MHFKSCLLLSFLLSFPALAFGGITDEIKYSQREGFTDDLPLEWVCHDDKWHNTLTVRPSDFVHGVGLPYAKVYLNDTLIRSLYTYSIFEEAIVDSWYLSVNNKSYVLAINRDNKKGELRLDVDDYDREVIGFRCKTKDAHLNR